MSTVKYLLPEDRMPTAWYNIQSDLPVPPPPVLHPGTMQPVGPGDLAPLFPMALIMQEVSTERWIEIPDEVREVYRQWRPSPLYRARRLEQALDTPAKIYYKYEGVSPTGSHKPNTAVPQAYYNKMEGVKRLTTETGAGQWGSSLAFAGSLYGLEVKVFMVKISYNQKPYRRAMMETFGASVTASPSNETMTPLYQTQKVFPISLSFLFPSLSLLLFYPFYFRTQVIIFCLHSKLYSTRRRHTASASNPMSPGMQFRDPSTPLLSPLLSSAVSTLSGAVRVERVEGWRVASPTATVVVRGVEVARGRAVAVGASASDASESVKR